MRAFLRQNWLYIALPIAVVSIGFLALLFLGEDSAADFIYPIH